MDTVEKRKERWGGTRLGVESRVSMQLIHMNTMLA